MEHIYKAVFNNTGEIFETSNFQLLYNAVKRELTSGYIQDMRKPETVFFYSIGEDPDPHTVIDERFMFIALQRKVENTPEGDLFNIVLHYGPDSYVLRSIRECSDDICFA